MIDLPLAGDTSKLVNPAHVVTIERAQSPENDAINFEAKTQTVCRVYLSDGRYLLAIGTKEEVNDILFPA